MHSDPIREASEKTVGAYVFVSIYLVLLAFFVALNAISIQVEDRRKAVLSSLGESFARSLPSSSRLVDLVEPIAPELVDTDPLSLISTLFADIAIDLDTRRAEKGHMLEITVPGDTLFFPGEARVAARIQPTLDHLAEVLNRPLPSRRLEMNISLGDGYSTNGALATDRAFALLAAMIRRGVATEALASGLVGARPDLAVLTFALKDDRPATLHYPRRS